MSHQINDQLYEQVGEAMEEAIAVGNITQELADAMDFTAKCDYLGIGEPEEVLLEE